MQSKEEIEKVLKAGEKLLKEAVPESSHQKYMTGYTNALKWVLGLKQEYITKG